MAVEFPQFFSFLFIYMYDMLTTDRTCTTFYLGVHVHVSS